MIVSHESRNCAVLTNGKKTTVLRYDADHLRKYSELYLYKWTEEKILKELREDLAQDIREAFPDEEEVFIEDTLDDVMKYARANIHDPREEVLG
jgi:hypothetical protein